MTGGPSSKTVSFSCPPAGEDYGEDKEADSGAGTAAEVTGTERAMVVVGIEVISSSFVHSVGNLDGCRAALRGRKCGGMAGARAGRMTSPGGACTGAGLSC